MPSFFLKNKKNGKRQKQSKDDSEIAAKMTRRQKIMAATEIHSDDEDSLVGTPQVSEAGSDVEYEDTHERNYREAKKLLEKIQTSVQSQEEVDQKLKEDAAAKLGVQIKKVADSIELDDEHEIIYKPHRSTPLCVTFSPDSKFLISAGKESSIVKYNIQQKKVVGVIKRIKACKENQNAHFGVIYALSVSQDQKFLASGGFDNVVKIWNFDTLEHIKDMSGHRGTIYSLCFQLKTNNLFSASQDRSVKMWDVDQLGLVDTMYGHQDAVQQISILSKPRVATAGGRDRTARLWKVEDESQLMFTGLSNCVSLDCVSMINEEHFATGSADGTLAIWSLWKKKPICTRLLAHGSENGCGRWIVSLTALQYTDVIATGSNEGELKLWKTGEGFKSISLFFTYSVAGFINSLQFAPNGKSIAIGVGKEHKDGRWWVEKKARNQIVLLPIRYSGEIMEDEKEIETAKGFESGSDDDNNEDEEEEEEENSTEDEKDENEVEENDEDSD